MRREAAGRDAGVRGTVSVPSRVASLCRLLAPSSFLGPVTCRDKPSRPDVPRVLHGCPHGGFLPLAGLVYTAGSRGGEQTVQPLPPAVLRPCWSRTTLPFVRPWFPSRDLRWGPWLLAAHSWPGPWAVHLNLPQASLPPCLTPRPSAWKLAARIYLSTATNKLPRKLSAFKRE